MKISRLEGAKPTGPAGRKKKASSATDGGFADELKEAPETHGTPPTIDAPSVNAVESILAVQEVPDATEERNRKLAREYGDDILERLEDLRRDLLIGAIPKERLADLAYKVRAQRGKTDDPRLREIIDEIDLRAKVEIAKFTRDV